MSVSQQEMVQELLEVGCQIEPDALGQLQAHHIEHIKTLSPAPMIITAQLVDALEQQLGAAPAEPTQGGEGEFEEQQGDETDVGEQQSGEQSTATDQVFVDTGERDGIMTQVEIMTEFDADKEERTLNDFVDYYNNRYQKLKRLLLRRRDIQSAMSVAHLKQMSEGEEVSAVLIVNGKHKAKSGKFIIDAEDPTGQMKLLVPEEDGEYIVEDEVIGVNGSLGKDIIFCDDVIWPDVPLPSEEALSKTDDEVYAAFISDIHFGSIDTLDERIYNFADWLNQDNEFTSKVKYLFVVGDMVEGVGVYPGQQEELEVEDIYQQYERFEEFALSIRDDIQIIICPGNHDMVRLAEPQPPIPEQYVPRLIDRENIHFVPNPAWVKVHGHDNGGVLVLMYHGYSFDTHVSGLQHLRDKAYEEPHHAMVDWIKRRHLAPIYSSNLVVPQEEDHLVIDHIPDIFCMGHTHSFSNETYKGVNVICAGTFQGQTDFQRRVGHVPDPGKVAMINLHTRESTVKEF